MRKIKYNKFGLAEDPRGLQIKMTYNDYALLGDVIDCYRAGKLKHSTGEDTLKTTVLSPFRSRSFHGSYRLSLLPDLDIGTHWFS